MMLPESLFEKFGVEFEPGEIIFCEWEPGEECFFIQDGRVKITKTVGNTQKTLDVIGAGDFFGCAKRPVPGRRVGDDIRVLARPLQP